MLEKSVYLKSEFVQSFTTCLKQHENGRNPLSMQRYVHNKDDIKRLFAVRLKFLSISFCPVMKLAQHLTVFNVS